MPQIMWRIVLVAYDEKLLYIKELINIMGNAFTERFNRTLMNMLGTLDPKEKSDWKKHVGTLPHAYNST